MYFALNSWCSLLSRENKGEINISKAEIKSYSAVMNDVINIFKVEFGLLRVVFCVCGCLKGINVS